MKGTLAAKQQRRCGIKKGKKKRAGGSGGETKKSTAIGNEIGLSGRGLWKHRQWQEREFAENGLGSKAWEAVGLHGLGCNNLKGKQKVRTRSRSRAKVLSHTKTEKEWCWMSADISGGLSNQTYAWVKKKIHINLRGGGGGGGDEKGGLENQKSCWIQKRTEIGWQEVHQNNVSKPVPEKEAWPKEKAEKKESAERTRKRFFWGWGLFRSNVS